MLKAKDKLESHHKNVFMLEFLPFAFSIFSQEVARSGRRGDFHLWIPFSWKFWKISGVFSVPLCLCGKYP